MKRNVNLAFITLMAAVFAMGLFFAWRGTVARHEHEMLDTLPPQWQDVVYVAEKGRGSNAAWVFVKENESRLAPFKLTRDQAKFIAAHDGDEAECYRVLIPFIGE